jgi:hypothetical protein
MEKHIMKEITRTHINEEWAHSGIVEAGDFVSAIAWIMKGNQLKIK